MARKSPGRIEDETVKKYMAKQALEMGNPSKESLVSPLEPDVTQDDIEAWYKDKVKSLDGIAEDELTPEMRKFLAFMKLKINRR